MNKFFVKRNTCQTWRTRYISLLARRFNSSLRWSSSQQQNSKASCRLSPSHWGPTWPIISLNLFFISRRISCLDGFHIFRKSWANLLATLPCNCTKKYRVVKCLATMDNFSMEKIHKFPLHSCLLSSLFKELYHYVIPDLILELNNQYKSQSCTAC